MPQLESLSAMLSLRVYPSAGVHKGVNIVSDFLLKVGDDSAFLCIGEIIPFQGLCDVRLMSSK